MRERSTKSAQFTNSTNVFIMLLSQKVEMLCGPMVNGICLIKQAVALRLAAISRETQKVLIGKHLMTLVVEDKVILRQQLKDHSCQWEMTLCKQPWNNKMLLRTLLRALDHPSKAF